ncbi:MAG: PF20097 family protein [Roseimicrobium sp.]
MTCPICRTPMEVGVIDKSFWISRTTAEYAWKINRALMSLFSQCEVNRVHAHRCPTCYRVELTAP